MKPTQFVNPIKNQRGQIAVEYILLSVIVLGVFLAVRNQLTSDNTMGNFVQKPWAMVAGMVETGVWGDPQRVRAQHPGSLKRHNSYKGDNP